MPRYAIWFSCGATSAVAAKLTLGERPDAEVVRIVIAGEHEDGNRFAADVERWLGKPIINLFPKQPDHWAVIEKHRYVNGPMGAKCTRELKIKTREAYQRPDDLHVFGFDIDEEDRINDFRERNPDLNIATPLIDAGLSKPDCLGILDRAGIEQHAMYKLGYGNANCIGCVKGKMGYWNKIRVDFPDVFERMAKLERNIGATCIRSNGESVYLDELDLDAGRDQKPIAAECTILCELALPTLGL